MSPIKPTMTTNTKLAPATAPAAKSNKKGSKLQRMNAKALRFQKGTEKLAHDFSALVAAMTVEERATKTGEAVSHANVGINTLAARAKDVPALLARLADLKWEPKGAAARVATGFKAGDLVALKEKRQERYTKNGAYEAKAIASLRVVSIHGDSCKIEIAGTKEPMGIVPKTWLRVAA